MEKIRYSEHILRESVDGNFTWASFNCSWLIYGQITKDWDGEDGFRVDIKPRLFRRPKFVVRRNILRSHGVLLTDLTAEDEDNLYRAWKAASMIQKVRQNESDAKEQQQKQNAHWWP